MADLFDIANNRETTPPPAPAPDNAAGGTPVPTSALEHEMQSSFLDYAMSVITDRALPDVRDGCKPVHRRILYIMSDVAPANKPTIKSARIVGDVM